MKTALATIRSAGPLRLTVVGLSVVLLLTAAVLGWRAHELRQDPSLTNRALLATEVQEDAVKTVSQGLTQVLSFDYTQPDATRAFADRVLSGQARQEYDTLFASLEERAPGQKLTLSAEVRVAGVRELTASRASMLVFVDQRSTRAKDAQRPCRRHSSA